MVRIVVAAVEAGGPPAASAQMARRVHRAHRELRPRHARRPCERSADALVLVATPSKADSRTRASALRVMRGAVSPSSPLHFCRYRCGAWMGEAGGVCIFPLLPGADQEQRCPSVPV